MNLKIIKTKRKQIRFAIREYIIQNFNKLNKEFNFNKSLKQIKMLPNSQFDVWITSISNSVLFCNNEDLEFEKFAILVEGLLKCEQEISHEEDFYNHL